MISDDSGTGVPLSFFAFGRVCPLGEALTTET